AGNATPRDGGTLRIAVKDQLSKLDPTLTNDEVTLYALHAIFDALVDYDLNLNIVPRLAETYEVSQDGLTYTFRLRAGLRYHDGTRIVAGDFKYALERALATAESPYKPFIKDIDGAEQVHVDKATNEITSCSGITTPSDRDVVIRLAKPNAAFLGLMTMV